MWIFTLGGIKMLIVTTDQIPGKEIKEAGCEQVLAEEEKISLDMALKRLISKAIDAGANAIVGMRFMTSSIIQGASEVIAYGTAVFVE